MYNLNSAIPFRCRSIVTNPEYVGSLPPLEYTDNLLCAVPKNEQRHVSACRGDGGGPLVSQVSVARYFS